MTWTFTKQPGYLLNVLVDSGLDWTIVWAVFIALGYRDPDLDIERHPRGWRDMAMDPQLPDPFGNKTGGLVLRLSLAW